MSVDAADLFLVAVVFAGYVLQTALGFGAMLVCVTLGALVLSIPEIVTLAVPISLAQTGYIALRHRGAIRWPLLLRRVLPLMGIGMVVGYGFVADVGGHWLKPLFGGMVLVLSLRELLLLMRVPLPQVAAAAGGGDAPPAGGNPLSSIALLGAGVVHGVYATGGPLLVYALGREELDKGAFRSSLAAIWVVLNVALTASFVADGRYDAEALATMALLLPGIPFGIAIGELIHHRVDEHRFKIIVFSLLTLAALALVLR